VKEAVTALGSSTELATQELGASYAFCIFCTLHLQEVHERPVIRLVFIRSHPAFSILARRS
jgi:hypothetical protein